MTTPKADAATPVLTVTPLAVERIKKLMAEKGLTEHALRVFVADGGCSGMQYGMAFDNNLQAADAVVESGGVRLAVDPVSAPYIRGASIDFVDTVMGGGFRIDNPNAVYTCGCGNSFRTADSQAEGDASDCQCGN